MENHSINVEIADRNDDMNSSRIQTKIYEFLTILTHVFLISFATFILYLCLSNELYFFTWHPVLLSIGWILLMCEGILIFSPHNLLVRNLSYKNKVKLHWIIQSVATGSCLIGFVIVYINKNLHDKPHFHSWHGIFGLIFVLMLTTVVITGIAALYSANIRNYVNPINSKFAHRVFGFVTFLIGGVSVLLSLYTHWFQRKVHQGLTTMWWIILIFIIMWCLKSVSVKIINRMKQLV